MLARLRGFVSVLLDWFICPLQIAYVVVLSDLDDAIKQMLEIDGPVILDVAVDDKENCYPMIPSGKPHNEMLLGPEDQAGSTTSSEGLALV